MPEQETVARARRDKKAGKAASTQAGEFVHEEMRHVRRGKHGARSTKQAIAIGLSKARRAGVKLRPPRGGKRKTRQSAARAYRYGQSRHPRRPSRRRSRAISGALKHESRRAASSSALARQARSSAQGRTARQRSAAARRAARTKGPAERSAAARKAARRRARHR